MKRPGQPFGPPQLLKSNWADIALAQDGSGRAGLPARDRLARMTTALGQLLLE